MPQNEVVTLPHRMPAVMTFNEIERLAEEVAKSGLFGMKTKAQALVLMSISQAEGRHPALAARDYNIIQNRPAKTAEAMQRDFMSAGGRIEWHDLSDDVADATFSHPQGGKVRITWDQARVKQAGLAGGMHQKYPRQMLRSRCVSEGVRTVYPMATSGMYVPEEVRDMPDAELPQTAADTTVDLDQFAAVTGEVEPPPSRDILAEARDAAERGRAAFEAFWQSLSRPERADIVEHMDEFRSTALRADSPFDLPPLPEALPVTEPPPSAGARDVFRDLEHEARAATKEGAVAFAAWWKTLRKADKDLLNAFKQEYEQMAADADSQRGLAL